MAVTFAEKLKRLPHYEAGMAQDEARVAFGTRDVVKLASNESPEPPHPAVQEAIRAAAAGANRYPAQHSAPLRERLAGRLDIDPARIAVGNGSCELLLAAAEALCEPGDEILYAWPSFSMYPHLPALSGAREVRVPLDAAARHDLDAMLSHLTTATQILLLCNPNNPTGTYIDAVAVAAFLELVPAHVTVVLDEAYVEFQASDDPRLSLDLAARHPNLCVLRTFSKCYGLAGLRAGYAICSPGLRAAMDAVRQPFSVNLLAQVAAAEALAHDDDVVARVERNAAERAWVEGRLADMGLSTAATQANFSWVDLGGRDEEQVFRGLAERGVVVRSGTGLGGPGHLRVTYGTRPENERFLGALGELV